MSDVDRALAAAATVALVAGGLLVPYWLTAGRALALIGCVLALVWLARLRAPLPDDETGADGERLPRWTVVAIPRSAALRDGMARSGLASAVGSPARIADSRVPSRRPPAAAHDYRTRSTTTFGAPEAPRDRRTANDLRPLPGRQARPVPQRELVRLPAPHRSGRSGSEQRRIALSAAIRSPRCPRCNELPALVVGTRQAFCDTDGCRVFTWDRASDPADFDAMATEISLSPRRAEAGTDDRREPA